MVILQKSGDSAVKFVFTDSDHYLYGNGEIEVPVNGLMLVIDESNMVTFKKLSGDPFISFNPANSNLSDKEGVINFYKTNMVGSTGGGSESGITSGDVQTMIDNSLEDYYTDDEVDAALSGKADASNVYTIAETNYLLNDLSQRKADTSALTAVANDVSTLSGQVATKVATSDFNAYSAATDARIAEDEEVTAAALNNLDERIGDPYQKVSGLTIQYNIDGQTPEVNMELEDEELGRVSNIFNKYGLDAYREDEETGHQSDAYIFNDGSMGVYEHSEGQEGNEDEGMSYDKQLDLHPDSLEFNTQTIGTDYEQSENVTISKDAITMYKNINDNGDITESTIEINNNQGGGDGTFIHLSDSDGQLELNTTNFDWTDGTDGGAAKQLNWGDIASTNDILDALFPIEETLSGKVDTSAITSSITSGSTDSEIPTAKATYDAIQAGGGGGATYSAGTNISIDTANTISCTLPITADTATSSTFIAGNPSSVVNENILIGSTSLFRTNYKNNVVIGNFGTKASNDCVVIGRNATGGTNNNYDWYNVAIGSLANANGGYHVALGYGVSATGTTKMNLNDQIKVDTNNQVYIKDKTNTTDVCIQDAIAALGGLKFVKLTQNEYDQLATKDANTLYIISNVVS